MFAVAVDDGRVPDDITCALNLEVDVGGQVNPYPGLATGCAERETTSFGGFVLRGFSRFNFMGRGPSLSQEAERIAATLIPALRALG